jgi:hypothetical protein
MKVSEIVLVAALAILSKDVICAGEDSKSTNGNSPLSSETIAAQATALTGHVISDQGIPLVGAQVRVAFPATVMRFVDKITDGKVWDTTTGAHGEFLLDLSGITKPGKISIDAMAPGYRKLAGTLMNGGDQQDLDVAPGAVVEATLKLKPALYIQGKVVDEQGQPVSGVEIAANAAFKEGSGGVERTMSNADGTFELFNYSVTPFADQDGNAKGIVHFKHPNFINAEIADVYSIAPNQQQALKVVLPAGRKISGTVLDVDGKPVPNLIIKATYDDWQNRKATTTDADGKFVLCGLISGKTTLIAHALAAKQKIRLPITLDRDQSDLVVRLQAITLSTKPPTFNILGMQLTDITPELRAVYDLYDKEGALILDAGKDFERLDIGGLEEGFDFWMVGENRVRSVREFVQQILAETANQNGEVYVVRVVYSFTSLEFDGTNTQEMKLRKNDLEQLRSVLGEISGSQKPR